MIVWGGNGIGFVNARYNPTTDNWTATTTSNAPAVRAGHTAVWTGSQMIVWGGWGIVGGFLNTGGKYCPESTGAASQNLNTTIKTNNKLTAYILRGSTGNRMEWLKE
jgi:hypothetical protein